MLVDVVALRHRGVRLSADEVRSIAPVRGILSLDMTSMTSGSDRRHPRLVAMLVSEGEPAWMLEPLDFARVTKIKRAALLIVGVQRYERPERVFDDYRQAWWVRPVLQLTQPRMRT